jgi:hypothetical protein
MSEERQILEQVFKMPKKKVITIDLCEDNETCEDIKTPIDKNKFIFDIHNDKVVLVWLFRPIADVRQVTIHNGDAFRIVNNEWLNDSFIEFGVWHFLLDRCSNREKAANVHYFDPMFLTQLKKHSLLHPSERYQIVKKMANGRLVFKKKVLIFPVNHKNIHWYMIAMLNPSSVCVPENSQKSGSSKDNAPPCFIILDSSAGRKSSRSYKENIELLKDYIVCEWLERGCTALQVRLEQVSFNTEIRKWVGVPVVLISTPQQPNSYDCGIYTIKNSEAILNHLESSSITDINDSFASFSSFNNFNVDDVLEHRHFLKVVITSLMQERTKVKECTQQVPRELFHVCTNAVVPEGTRIVPDCTNEGKVMSFTEDFLNVILKTDILDLILSFLIDKKNTREELLIQKKLRHYSKLWYELGFLGSELNILKNV